MRQTLLLATAAALSLPMTLNAHPHLFVEVGVVVIFEDDRLAGVRLEWAYDDFFSLLLTTDLGIDIDGDLVLEPSELEQLTLAVTNWPEDFRGDLEVSQHDEVLALGARSDHAISYANGLILETHTRPLATPVSAADPVVIRVYDPFYYVAYTLAGPVQIEGRDDCEVGVVPPNLNDAYSLVDELLYGRPAADVGPDEVFPEVGISFAETISITCAR